MIREVPGIRVEGRSSLRRAPSKPISHRMGATPPNPGKTRNQRGDDSNQIPAAGTPYSRPKSVQRRGEASL
jgi:hypothetical protein